MSSKRKNNNKTTDKKTIRCIECRTEFTDKEARKVDACPKCKSNCTPEPIAQDITINTNWHILRVLVNFAISYAETCDTDVQRTVNTITESLRPYRPKDAPPLTLLEEVKELAEEMGINVEIVKEEATKVSSGSKMVN